MAARRNKMKLILGRQISILELELLKVTADADDLVAKEASFQVAMSEVEVSSGPTFVMPNAGATGIGCVKELMIVFLHSRELRYPTFGKDKSSSKVPW